MVVKLHPHDVASFRGDFTAIRVLTQEQMQDLGLTVYTLLPAIDGLLTDVSSIWVDYLLPDRPLVFAFPDIDAYRRVGDRRGARRRGTAPRADRLSPEQRAPTGRCAARPRPPGPGSTAAV